MVRRGNGTGTLVKQPSGLFIAKWTFQGKTYTRSTKTHVEEEAMKRLNEFVRPFLERSKIAVIENLQAKVRTSEKEKEAIELEERKCVKIEDVYTIYLQDHPDEELSKSSSECYITYVKIFSEFIHKNYKWVQYVYQVKKDMCEAFLKDLLHNKKRSANTYNGYLTSLKRFYDYFLGENNCWSSFEKKMAVVEHPRKSLSKAELKRLLDFVKQDENMNVLFHIGVYTGLRLSDCCLMKWENVDFDSNLIHIIPLKVKRFKREVFIPMHPVLRSVLESMYNENCKRSDYVSARNARLYGNNDITRFVRQVFYVCELKVHGDLIGFHVLRHTFVSICANSGVPLPIVQSIVGHSCVEMTNHYYHLDTEIAMNAISKMSL